MTITKTICVKIFDPTKVKERILSDMLTISGDPANRLLSDVNS